ncbi:MAG TPA: tRNA preQ1(34) S-adenosylmethionine ribosyltransferase-isomerase QueA [Planctomycetota bacterium]|nr:tRNA preQ1(34) S-adenosylmethionine ribosyltransferase-isomerase QueA [Planctomycetota bacterium]
MLSTHDFDFTLDPARIAQTPCTPRDASKLMVLHRDRLANGTAALEHRTFRELPRFLRAGDTLVVNRSRVIPARLFGERIPTGGKVEFLLVRPVTNLAPASLSPNRAIESALPHSTWLCLSHARAHLKPGDLIRLPGAEGISTEVIATFRERRGPAGDVVDFGLPPASFNQWLRAVGELPLPPYIQRREGDGITPAERIRLANLDAERYQTVYARADGSVAAPTAGLHFTPELLDALRAQGVRVTELILHVGPGTFRPVKTEALGDHVMHEEFYEIPPECVEAIEMAQMTGGRVVAVGTTSLRAIESACLPIAADAASSATRAQPAGSNRPRPGPGRTELFIYPPRQFHCVSGLVTNFHLPKSTLLMLVAAFAAPGSEAGVAAIQAAYQTAIAQEYRFFSYGDAMLLL